MSFVERPPLDLTGLTGTEESARVLDVTRHTVTVWCIDGTLPAVKIGPTYVLRRADVAAMAAERKGRRP
jgi:excisionase family DNA binding protein